jgi:type 1 glutamine amidotransferase
VIDSLYHYCFNRTTEQVDNINVNLTKHIKMITTWQKQHTKTAVFFSSGNLKHEPPAGNTTGKGLTIIAGII